MKPKETVKQKLSRRLKPYQRWVAVTRSGKHVIPLDTMAIGQVEDFLKETNTRLGLLEIREIPIRKNPLRKKTRGNN